MKRQKCLGYTNDLTDTFFKLKQGKFQVRKTNQVLLPEGGLLGANYLPPAYVDL